ncbi:homoserine dehydrogenase [Sulfolobus acidocaldarius]|nr:homoserine dehydrogenase [Sulfolobus acidocaldarius]ALU30225.1 homoserine dehydrogenase [Sulfolobus acidocaldarius]ALU30940.1 homoserine dehydrogenase [Sulfolobus acidocaldarius]
MKILLLGYGNVGKAFRSLIHEKKSKIRELKDIEIAGVVTSKGIMLGDKQDFTVDYKGDIFLAYEKLNPDAVIDTLPANYKDGSPSLQLYMKVLKDDRIVITANKAPLALAFKDIVGKGRVGFQATVMSGTPSINLFRVLPGSEVKRIRGILNGTTNYILTKMYNGLSFTEALKDAQTLGYAESDPTNDISGFDAGAKLTILANLMLNLDITIRDVKIEGIQNLDSAKRDNKKIKLIAYADEKTVQVRPVPLLPEDPLFSVDGVENGLEISTDIQTIVIRGPGAGPKNAAYGLLSDLILMTRGWY